MVPLDRAHVYIVDVLLILRMLAVLFVPFSANMAKVNQYYGYTLHVINSLTAELKQKRSFLQYFKAFVISYLDLPNLALRLTCLALQASSNMNIYVISN